jgi:endonuclease YncB( thermonuclease family)
LARISDWLLTGLMLVALMVVAVGVRRVSTETLSGTMIVVDGDSLVHGGRRLRIQGIDAPELTQVCQGPSGEYGCGQRAKQALTQLVAGGATCSGADIDRYDRLLVTCSASNQLGREIDVGREMVLSGWAISYGGYDVDETLAREASAGLWAGKFERPRQWRISHGDAGDSEHSWANLARERLRAMWQRLVSAMTGKGTA